MNRISSKNQGICLFLGGLGTVFIASYCAGYFLSVSSLELLGIVGSCICYGTMTLKFAIECIFRAKRNNPNITNSENRNTNIKAIESIQDGTKRTIESIKQEKKYHMFEIMSLGSAPQFHEIIPGIFLANEAAVKSKDLLKANGVTHLLCALSENQKKEDVEKSHFHFPENFSYFRVPIPWGETRKNSEKLLQILPQTFDIIEKVISTNGCIAIYCNDGCSSRSSTIVVAYLMRKYQVSFEQAHNFVSQFRYIYKWDFNHLLSKSQ